MTMLNSLNRHDRRWLVDQLREGVEHEEEEAKKSWDEFMASRSTWEEEDGANLDAFLENISGKWGGKKKPVELAAELRQVSEMVRNVDTW